MINGKISIPSVLNLESASAQIEYEVLFEEFKKAADSIPDVMSALKAADNEGWQQIVDDLTLYIEKTPRLASYIKLKDRNGAAAVSIGEPNVLIALVGAFAVGYGVGLLINRLLK